jgi:hypothetical protein
MFGWKIHENKNIILTFLKLELNNTKNFLYGNEKLNNFSLKATNSFGIEAKTKQFVSVHCCQLQTVLEQPKQKINSSLAAEQRSF